MTNRIYFIKNVEATSEYQNIVFTQRVEISFNSKTVWVEDNLMLIDKKTSTLPKNVFPRMNINGIYKYEKDIPLEKRDFTICCIVKADGFVEYNSIDYYIEDKLFDYSIGDNVWLFVYLKDLVKIS